MTQPAIPLDTITCISTTSIVAIPSWATAAPPKSNGASHLLPSRPNKPLHRSGASPQPCPPPLGGRPLHGAQPHVQDVVRAGLHRPRSARAGARQRDG